MAIQPEILFTMPPLSMANKLGFVEILIYFPDTRGGKTVSLFFRMYERQGVSQMKI